MAGEKYLRFVCMDVCMPSASELTARETTLFIDC